MGSHALASIRAWPPANRLADQEGAGLHTSPSRKGPVTALTFSFPRECFPIAASVSIDSIRLEQRGLTTEESRSASMRID